MGCDYYTWIETVIEYKDLSGNLRTYIDKPDFEQYERNYEYNLGNTYDPDFEDRPENNELDQKILFYGVKVLFENGKWLCNENGKARIMGILNKEFCDMSDDESEEETKNDKIPVESLVKVIKRMNGYWR